MDKQKFLKTLEALVDEGKRNGNILSRETLEKACTDYALSAEQEIMLAEYLRQHKIGIDERLPEEELLSEEDVSFLSDYLLTLEEMELPAEGEFTALKISAMAGERDAQQQLAVYMLPKVPEVARLYAGQDVAVEDLIGAGNEALLRGAALLAPLEGPHEVEGELLRHVMNAMEELIAENLEERAAEGRIAEKVMLVSKKAKELSDMLGRKVTPEELAGEGELLPEEIAEALLFAGYQIEGLDADPNA